MAWARLTSCSDEGAELPKGCSAVGHALRVIEGISAARGVESAGGAVPEGRSEPTAQAGFRLTCSPRSSIGPSPPRRSSNRTCGFLASGSRTDFTRRHSTQEAPKLDYAEVTVHLDVPEPRCPAGQLVPPSQEVPRTRRDVFANSGEITPPCGVPHFERFPPLYRGRPCSSLSSTGTFSHILTRCSIAASATLRARQVINSACGIVSKYFERSASTTSVRRRRSSRWTSCTARMAPRSGRYP